MIRNAVFFGAPFVPPALAPLPLTAVMPTGWLLEELRAQLTGQTGRLQEIWPDVGPQNGWLGGEGHAWERGPYYLDGYLPLAYLLRDKKAMERAQAWIEWTLASQREDGFFGPAANEDWWPRSVMLKVLWQYYTATADKRVPLFLLKYFRYMAKNLDGRPFADWAQARGPEALCTLLPLYGLTKKPFLATLARKICDLSLDWTQNFHAFPYKQPTAKLLPWEDLRRRRANADDPQDQQYAQRQYHFTHVVNNAMALKYPQLQHAATGNIKAADASRAGWDKLMKHHGVAIGLFTGDEHLAGPSPSQGTETCAVVEAMYSLEVLLGLTGEADLCDKLEKLAFGALPASMSPDRMGHQYLQQVNQVACTDTARDWYNNGSRANLFGLEPNFGCCTANRHQGWPKFAQHLWMAAPDGLAAISYAPCRVRAMAGGVLVRLDVKSDYPFREDVAIKLSMERPARFALRLHVPQWAQGAVIAVNGQDVPAAPGAFAVLEREFAHGDEIRLRLPMAPRVGAAYHQSLYVERGPLLFALPLAERWTCVAPHPAAPDYEVTTEDPWAFGLDPAAPISVTDTGGPAIPFKRGEPPVTLSASLAPVHAWHMKNGSAAPPPVLPAASGPAQPRVLVPYGFTSLRVAQFPVVKGAGADVGS